MGITVASIGSKGDTAARSAYTCPLTRAPDANKLVLVGVIVNDTGAVPPTGVRSTSMVFSQVTDAANFNNVGGGNHDQTIWRSMSGTPDGSIVTVTFAANATGCAILVHEVSGISTSGTSGANAVGQSAITVKDGVSSLKVVGPSATSTANAWIAFQSAISTEVAVANSDFQQIDTVGFLTADTHIVSAWTTLSTGTSVTFTASGVDDRGITIIELVADNPAEAGGAVFSPYYATYYYPQVVASC